MLQGLGIGTARDKANSLRAWEPSDNHAMSEALCLLHSPIKFMLSECPWKILEAFTSIPRICNLGPGWHLELPHS
jgi:hypothetical protein